MSRQLLCPDLKSFHDIFSDSMPWRVEERFDLPKRLHNTNWATAKAWIKSHPEDFPDQTGRTLSMCPDQTYACLTQNNEAPDEWTQAWEGTDCNLITGRRFSATMTVSPFTSVRGGPSLYCKARPEILKAARASLLFMEDTLNFQITKREDGTALVTIDHNRISGGRWIALIDASTIPHQGEEV